jgi:hypothetical protein
MKTTVYARELTYTGETVGQMNDDLETIFQALNSCIGETEEVKRAAMNIRALLYGGYFSKAAV